ncbi:MAG: Penicillin-binding protein beta-lactamase, partial [Blastococcus sp.]|nr:Penicillin-binding protein beta-lactamase [Blastococcus sp.]
MAEVHGSYDERFAGVREALARQLDGDELGASVAVDLDGETVVDIWGGYRDAERTTPWTQDTIVNVWSTTKCVLNLAALVLVERGELDPYAPVGDYWPEFSAHGKKNVQVRHLMSHTSGVSGWEHPFSVRDMYDWETATERLAQQRPWWEPGTASGYHSSTQGFLVGEVIRRVTNKTFQKFVADEIAGPLGADFQVGARERDWGRTASLVAPPRAEPAADIDPNSIAVRTFTAPVMSVKATGSPEWRAADLGALNGHSNAR